MKDFKELFRSGDKVFEDKKLFSLIIKNNKEKIVKQRFYLKGISFGWFLDMGISKEGYSKRFHDGRLVVHLPFIRVHVDWDWSCLYKKYGAFYTGSSPSSF